MPDQKQDAQKATAKQDAKPADETAQDQPKTPTYIVGGKRVDPNGQPVKG